MASSLDPVARASRQPSCVRAVGKEPEPTAALQAQHARVAQLFAEHADFVFRLLRRFGTPEIELEDALQEVFLIVARKLPDYEERGGMRAWLFAIARQVSSDTRRASLRRERRHRGLFVFETTEDDPHATLERNQAVRFLHAFLAQLDPRQAEVFYLAEVEGMSAPEIAGALQVKLNTVYSRLRLARERFERALRRLGEGRPL